MKRNMTYYQHQKLDLMESGWELAFAHTPFGYMKRKGKTKDPFYPYHWRRPTDFGLLKWDRMCCGETSFPKRTWGVLIREGWVDASEDVHFDGTKLTVYRISEKGKAANASYIEWLRKS